MATEIKPTTTGGGRRPSEETREKLRAKGQAAWAALSDEQKAARLAILAKGRAPKPSTDPPPANGGPRSPLDDPLGAAPGPRPSSQGRLNGHPAPPIFRVPDIPPLELGGPPDPAGIPGDELGLGPPAPGIDVSQAQVETLLGFPFDLVALRRGDHWKLRADERAMIAEPLTRKINEHALAARAIGAGGDWAVIVGGLAIVVTARVAEDRARAGNGGDRAPGDGSGAGSGAPPPDDGLGYGHPGSGDAGPGGGSLNGVSLGAAAAHGLAPLPTEAPSGPLRQAL